MQSIEQQTPGDSQVCLLSFMLASISKCIHIISVIAHIYSWYIYLRDFGFVCEQVNANIQQRLDTEIEIIDDQEIKESDPSSSEEEVKYIECV